MAKTVADKLSEILQTGNLMDYTRQIWLAGLGAFAKAEREGDKFFEALVKRGGEVEAQLRKTAEEQVDTLRGKAEQARDRASDTWNKLEQVFHNRVARALTRLGVPTREDVQALTGQMEALQATLQTLLQSEEVKALPDQAETRDTAPAAQ